MLRRSRSIAIVLWLSGAVVLGAAQRAAPPGTDGRGQSSMSRSSGSQALSPSVIGSKLITREGDGPERLEVLVLWRGSPGWFMRSTGSRRSGSGGGATRSPLIEFSIFQGGLHLSATFDRATRIVNVLGEEVRLGNANVVLVDLVDDPAGPRVLKTMTATPRGSSSLPHAAFISTPELLDYLRCLAQIPEPMNRSPMSFVCAEAIALGLVTGERTVTPIPTGVVQNRATDTTGPPEPAPRTGPSESSGNGVLSPVVMGGWFMTRQPSGDAALDLLVIWRGAPGWHLGTSRGGAGGRSDGRQRMSLAIFGVPTLSAVLDRAAKLCWIQGKRVPLGNNNVILVDRADSAEATVVKAMRVDPELPARARIDTAIRRSPELIEFLRCDLKLPDARQQAMMDLICARYR
jgi:hypothetical protein